MDKLDIVELIEKNPITKLSSDYNIKLLCKIKDNFTDMEQQLFLSSFYCYLNYGNAKKYSLKELWNNKIISKTREEHQKKNRNKINPCDRCGVTFQ